MYSDYIFYTRKRLLFSNCVGSSTSIIVSVTPSRWNLDGVCCESFVKSKSKALELLLSVLKWNFYSEQSIMHDDSFHKTKVFLWTWLSTGCLGFVTVVNVAKNVGEMFCWYLDRESCINRDKNWKFCHFLRKKGYLLLVLESFLILASRKLIRVTFLTNVK